MHNWLDRRNIIPITQYGFRKWRPCHIQLIAIIGDIASVMFMLLICFITQIVTFQAVLISDGTKSFVMFNYKDIQFAMYGSKKRYSQVG